MNFIPHNQPSFDKNEIIAVSKVLRSKWIIGGEEVKKFENKFKKIINRKYALAVNNGHAALHLSLLALNIQRGDEVIVPSFTVSDVINPIFYVGARPILVDIKKGRFSMDYTDISDKITKKTKAIIIPYMFGFSTRVDKIIKSGIPIVEDCAQALGSSFRNKPLGSFGDLAIFSFSASKIITTGQGGIVATNNKNYYENIKDLTDYNGRDNYRVRYNYQMTDLAACIGNIQLGKLNNFIKRRKEIASKYKAILDKKNLTYWPSKRDDESNYFRFIIDCGNALQKNQIKKKLFNKGIITGTPVPPEELLHNLLNKDGSYFRNSQILAEKILSLPIYPSLINNYIKYITTTLGEIL